MCKWIDIENKKPVEGSLCLVYMPDEDVNYELVRYAGGKWRYSLSMVMPYRVTHWSYPKSPLPKINHEEIRKREDEVYKLYLQNKSYREICEALNLNYETVTNSLFKARKRMK